MSDEEESVKIIFRSGTSTTFRGKPGIFDRINAKISEIDRNNLLEDKKFKEDNISIPHVDNIDFMQMLRGRIL